MKKDKWYWFLLYIFGRRCHQPYGDRDFYCYHRVGKRCLRNSKKCRYKKNRLESI